VPTCRFVFAMPPSNPFAVCTFFSFFFLSIHPSILLLFLSFLSIFFFLLLPFVFWLRDRDQFNLFARACTRGRKREEGGVRRTTLIQIFRYLTNHHNPPRKFVFRSPSVRTISMPVPPSFIHRLIGREVRRKRQDIAWLARAFFFS